MMTYLFRRGVLFFLIIFAVLLVLVAIYAQINAESFSFKYFRAGLAAVAGYGGFLVYANDKNEEYLKPRHERIFLLSCAAFAFILVGAICYLTWTVAFMGKGGLLLFAKIPVALAVAFSIYTYVRFREAAEFPTYYAVKKRETTAWRAARETVLSLSILLFAFYCIARTLP